MTTDKFKAIIVIHKELMNEVIAYAEVARAWDMKKEEDFDDLDDIVLQKLLNLATNT